MASSLTSPADIVNAALSRVGIQDRVGNLYEGSKQAKNALDIFGQTRDQLLRMGEWPFAQRDAPGNLLKSAPVGGYVPPNTWNSSFPPLPWLYEYEYFSDCINVRAVKPAPIFVPNFSPQPHLFAIANDGADRVILSNVANAVVTYVGQVTDPLQMPPDFLEAFVAALARRFAPLTGSLDAVKLEAQDEAVETQAAERRQG